MSKKVVLVLGIAAVAAYLAFGNKNESGAVVNDEPNNGSEDIFVQYDNHLVTDAAGNFMLFKNGGIYTFADQAAVQAWAGKNPGYGQVTLPGNIWEQYSATKYVGLA